jgi:hypothetical protein
MLTALMTFQDANDLYHTPEGSSSSVPRQNSGNLPAAIAAPVPAPPPKPPKKLGIDRIAEIQALRGQFNEVTVEDEGSIEDYAQYCSNLFQVRITALYGPRNLISLRMMRCYSSLSSLPEQSKFLKCCK